MPNPIHHSSCHHSGGFKGDPGPSTAGMGYPLPHRFYTAKGNHSPATRISEIGALTTKITQKNWEKNQHAIGKNMDSECTICIHFLYARLVGTYYGMALASVCLSVRLSVRLSTKLVDTIQTEPFQLGPSNLVHRLLMTRGRTLLIFKVMGQRSRSQATHCC